MICMQFWNVVCNILLCFAFLWMLVDHLHVLNHLLQSYLSVQTIITAVVIGGPDTILFFILQIQKVVLFCISVVAT